MSQPARRVAAPGAIVHGRDDGRITLDPIRAGADTVHLAAFTPRDDDHITGRDGDQAGVELDLVGAIALMDELGKVIGPLAATTTAERLQTAAAERLHAEHTARTAQLGADGQVADDPVGGMPDQPDQPGRLVKFPDRRGH